MAPSRFAAAPAALIALAAGASVAHAIKARDGLGQSRLGAVQQVVESTDMRQMASSIQTWLEEEESKDNLFVTMFRQYFTIPNATAGSNQTHLTVTTPDSPEEDVSDAGDLPGLIFQRGEAQFNLSRRLEVSQGHEPQVHEEHRMPLSSEVSLDQHGYRTLVDHGRQNDMEDFAQRIIKQSGLRVLDKDTFHEVLRYYDGECATQTFHALKAEVKRALHSSTCRSAWLAPKDSAANLPPARRFLARAAKDGVRGIGATAPLKQLGYHEVATKGRSGEMAEYVKRVVKLMNLEITSDWGLHHFVSYHSGECSTQRFVRLVEQLHRAVDQPVTCGGGWVKPMMDATGTRKADLGASLYGDHHD